MPNRAPRVSVCMPARNCAPYLTESLDSVLSQSAGDLELIVCDDASTDETEALVRSYRDPRVRYFRQRRRRGIPATRNACLQHVRGEFVIWLDADDRLLPGAIDALVDAADADPAIGLAHGAFDVIGEDGRLLPAWPMPFDADVVERGIEAFRELAVLNYITAPVLVRRGCHAAAGPFATDIGPSSTDWEMWLRVALRTDLAYVARRLSQYRQHSGSISAATGRPGVRLRCDAAAVVRVFTHCRRAIPNARTTFRHARVALLAKAVLVARDAVTRGDWRLAADAVRPHLDDTTLCGADARRLVGALDERDELAFHVESREVLGAAQRVLADTRFGRRLEPMTLRSEDWERTLEAIAATVRGLVPPNACVAAVDKWDPTLLRLAGRTGFHFPDRRLMPDGYPVDSDGAIAHLEELHRRGASYFVVPSAAFWWLQHYGRFAGYLEARCEKVWRDEQCAIFRLAARGV